MRYATPDTLEGNCTLELELTYSHEFLAILIGAITDMTFGYSWDEIGTVTADECIAAAMTILATAVLVYEENFMWDYDSGWFAVAHNVEYNKAHGLADTPRLVRVLHCPNADGSGEWATVENVYSGTFWSSIIHANGTNVRLKTANSATYGTCNTTLRSSGSGYYRVLAKA